MTSSNQPTSENKNKYFYATHTRRALKTYKQMMGYEAPKAQLNPALWYEDETLKTDVKHALFDRARDFVTRIGLQPSAIEDVLIVGGNASYDYSDASDADVTILLDRKEDLDKEDIRRLGLASTNLTYKLSPSINGIDLNFYISQRNIGGTRPAKQGIYSLGKNEWLRKPTNQPELHPNFLTSKANFFAEQIEECINDESPEGEGCAKKLLDKLKRYRLKGLKSSKGEESTANLVWRLLSRSDYIQLLKDKILQLEKDYYRIQTPSLIQNEEFRALIKKDGSVVYPSSILQWNKRLLRGDSPEKMIARIKPIIELLIQEYLAPTKV